MRKDKLIKIIIIFQIIFCLSLIFNIYKKRNNVLGSQTSVSPINKNSVQKIESKNLKYYYEYQPNETIIDSSVYTSKSITFKYNNDGFNDLNNYLIEKKQNTFRVIVIGDSFTYGDHVATQDNWTELLENKLNSNKICKNIDNFEIINTAVMGYDPEYEVEQYKRKGQKYNPNLIVWMLTDNIRLNEVNLSVEKDCYQKYGDRENPTMEIIKKCRTLSTDVLSKEVVFSNQKQNISKIYNYYNGKIFFIDYFQNSHQNIIELKNNTYFANFLEEYLKSTKYTYKDVHFTDSHPNQLSHKLSADLIYKKLFELNQIPCEPIN